MLTGWYADGWMAEGGAEGGEVGAGWEGVRGVADECGEGWGAMVGRSVIIGRG